MPETTITNITKKAREVGAARANIPNLAKTIQKMQSDKCNT